MSILDKAQEVGSKIAEKAELGIEAAKDASLNVVGPAADVANTVAGALKPD
jgi:hypothetical protein